MKKFLKIFLGILFLALLVGTFVFLWNKTRPVKVVYTLATPVHDTIRQYVIASGKVEPRDEVLIKPQISGIISEVLCKAGDRVKQGDVIATVKVIPEMGTLNAAESRVTVARLSLDQTRKEFERTEALYAKGVVSQEEFEKGQTTLRQAEEEFQNAEDNLEIVKTGITNRYKDLSNTQIRSTITGMILDVPIKVGNSVIQANTFNDGTTIATVADMGDMLFRGNVDETDIGRLHAGMPVVLTIGAMQGTVLQATLEYISPKAADVNGIIMFEVKAAAKIPESVFVRAGYSANASIVTDSREGVLTLPESIDETDIGRLHAGMPVVLTIGAMQGTVLQATLEYISPKAADVNGIIMFEVKAAAKIPESVFVRAGYSANASIVTDSREGVLTLPESTIQFEEGKPCVYILTSPEESPEQTFEKRDVTLGLSDGVNIEIVSGVTETDKVRNLQQQSI